MNLSIDAIILMDECLDPRLAGRIGTNGQRRSVPAGARFSECRAEDAGQQAIERAAHRQECTEDKDDTEDFIEDARAALNPKVFLGPLDSAEVVDQPLGLEHEQHADADHEKAGKVLHSVIVRLTGLVGNAGWRG